MIDGSNHLLRIAHAKEGPLGCWKLIVTESTDLSGAIPAGDNSVGLVPDYAGNVWFATGNGVVGVAKPGGGVASCSCPPVSKWRTAFRRRRAVASRSPPPLPSTS